MTDDLGQVRWMARQMVRGKPSRIDVEDLTQVGYEALLHAQRDFDADLGVKLWSYAQHRVRGAILDYMREDGRLRLRHERRVERAERSAAQRLGRTPTSQEIADEMGVTLDALDKLTRRFEPEDESPPTPYDCVAAQEIWQVVEQLPALQQQVITLYYGHDMLQAEIAAALGFTHSYISMVLTAARAQLQARLAG